MLGGLCSQHVIGNQPQIAIILYLSYISSISCHVSVVVYEWISCKIPTSIQIFWTMGSINLYIYLHLSKPAMVFTKHLVNPIFGSVILLHSHLRWTMSLRLSCIINWQKLAKYKHDISRVMIHTYIIYIYIHMISRCMNLVEYHCHLEKKHFGNDKEQIHHFVKLLYIYIAWQRHITVYHCIVIITNKSQIWDQTYMKATMVPTSTNPVPISCHKTKDLSLFMTVWLE